MAPGQDRASARREAYAVTREESGGAWVVLMGTCSVEVMGASAFGELLAKKAVRGGQVLKVVRPDGDGFRVERWQGGVIRSADDTSSCGHAIERFDGNGRLSGLEHVRAEMPDFPIWGVDVRVRPGEPFEFVPRKSPSERRLEALGADDVEGSREPNLFRPEWALRA